jgi:transcriptional regulator with XRE-family HTH domain
MLKSLHTKHNEVFLTLLRNSRTAVPLRQADLALRLGHAQATVSKVERGERRLDVIELRAWLSALEVDFLSFMKSLDEGLRGAPAQGVHVRRSERGARRGSELP